MYLIRTVQCCRSFIAWLFSLHMQKQGNLIIKMYMVTCHQLQWQFITYIPYYVMVSWLITLMNLWKHQGTKIRFVTLIKHVYYWQDWFSYIATQDKLDMVIKLSKGKDWELEQNKKSTGKIYWSLQLSWIWFTLFFNGNLFLCFCNCDTFISEGKFTNICGLIWQSQPILTKASNSVNNTTWKLYLSWVHWYFIM